MTRTRYQPWSAEEVAWLKDARARGATFTECAAALGRTASQVSNKVQAAGLVFHPKPRVTPQLAPVPVGTSAPEPTFGATLEDLRPVQIERFPARRGVTADAAVTVAAGDFHFPAQDDAAVAVLLETVRQLRPKRVILNGDLPDLLAISKYPKDARKAWDLRDEATAMHRFLHELEAVLPKDAEVIETEANHSGDGVGSRWWRYLSDRVPQLLAMPGADEKLGYRAWWHPQGSRIQIQESVMVGDLLVVHGDIVRKWGAFSARAHAEKYVHSVLHSHTHRQGSSVQRVPAIGARPESTIRSFEIGCMCGLEPIYTSKPNWTTGFAVLTDAGATTAVELVTIIAGRACVGALGKEVRAA